MNSENGLTNINNEAKVSNKISWGYLIVLTAIIVFGAYLRFVGIDWGENNHLHPDERFLTMVETAIQPVDSLKDYFDTQNSSLNPNNRGYTFYVYGTLPIFIVRYIAEWVGQTGYDQVHIVGRMASALFDLMTVVLVFFISWKLYKNIKLSLLATGFSSAAVMQLQLAHYFTVDSFALFFTVLSIYFAVMVLKSEQQSIVDNTGIETSKEISSDTISESTNNEKGRRLLKDRSYFPYILFGISFGMALASKISVAPLALILPVAACINISRYQDTDKDIVWLITLKNLFIAAVVSFFIFRIFQPYAFSGPGFFGLRLNQNWLSSLHDLSLQSAGDVDFPPALQWARRPIWFAWENMIKWGLGLPLGLLAWTGFVWMGFKIFKSEWKQHLLIWSWTGVYFLWQSINFTRSMRYQLPIYPMLCIIAAWFVVEIWTQGKYKKRPSLYKASSLFLGFGVLISTFLWGYAFSRIYTRPVTRVEASRWIYQNVPGAINLRIESEEGTVNQPLPFRSETSVTVDDPLQISFKPDKSGILQKINFSNVVDQGAPLTQSGLRVQLFNIVEPDTVIAESLLLDPFAVDSDPRGSEKEILFENSPVINTENEYYFKIIPEDSDSKIKLSGLIYFEINDQDKIKRQYLPDPVEVIKPDKDYAISFKANRSGEIKQIYLPHLVDWEAIDKDKTLQISIKTIGNNEQLGSSGEISGTFNAEDDIRGSDYTVDLKPSFHIDEGTEYYLQIALIEGQGSIAIYGSKQANESSWDDVLPIGLDGYNPYDYYMGVYRTELNFEMYWDDNEEKRERFINILDQADYLFISSNRQWGTTVRVPERYPLTTAYYQNLIGCPDGSDILWCYRVAAPNMFDGSLGFDLVNVFQSDPNIGNIRFNTQFAEEAFTVYDHPKVLIFKKNSDYEPEKVAEILGAVDLTQVIHVTPGQAKSSPGNLMLPLDRLSIQRSNGTWSDLFNRDKLVNRYPFIDVITWYLVILLLGLIFYPLVRIVFYKLPDRGYPISKLVAMLFVAFIIWILSSAGIAFSKLTISIVLLITVLINTILFFKQRQEIKAEFKEKWKYFLIVEAISLIFFVCFLLFRLGNPDLWHPSKGGEKPMNFSYFNAILKSTTFPPYDPWYAGGYINYYYYGYVIIGVLVKWLGIIPSVAYNFILPTWFSFTAIASFSFGFNVYRLFVKRNDNEIEENSSLGIMTGLLSSFFLLIIGNLGTVKMIWQGMQKIAAPDGIIENANIINRWSWGLSGLIKLLGGDRLPYGPGEWYWNPSRVIPGEPITEFPFFTFIYADLHAHLIALPITIIVILWCLSMLARKWDWQYPKYIKGLTSFIITLFFGGLFIGALYPTNTWDYYTYLIFALIALAYTFIKYANLEALKKIAVSDLYKRIILAIILGLILFGLSRLLYAPFYQWFGQGYKAIELWKGDHTPFRSYATHWGLFLFVVVSWLIWETREWMANSPASSLNKLKPYVLLIESILVLVLLIIAGLLVLGVSISWLAIVICLWAGLLILRPGQRDTKRFILFMIGTASILTLAVELVVIKGDIGRMNTVFKFYYQAWTLFALSSSIALVWLIPSVIKVWNATIKNIWTTILSLLIVGAALFPIFGGTGKIVDRMASDAPATLNGMTYMAYSSYSFNSMDMDLVHDYNAIRWMQDNVIGSPVIVEANTVEYHWGSRYTIYTGLPGVVGWNWHQRQQRSIVPSEWVTDRVDEIGDFYNTTDINQAEQFLNKYDVEYIVVGQLERANYENEGIAKFKQYDGLGWELVYQGIDTEIYQVIN